MASPSGATRTWKLLDLPRELVPEHPVTCHLVVIWRWAVLPAGAELIEGVEEAPEDILLAIEQVREVCAVDAGPTYCIVELSNGYPLSLRRTLFT